jgi:ribosome assembly protein 1
LNRIPDFNLLNSCFGANAQNLQLDKFSINDMRYQLENNFVSGFQLATLSGPLCDEPLMSVCFIVEEWTISDVTQETGNDPFGPFSGQIMSTVKECCKKAFQAQPQRLMAAMFSSTIQVDSDALGEFRSLILYLLVLITVFE